MIIHFAPVTVFMRKKQKPLIVPENINLSKYRDWRKKQPNRFWTLAEMLKSIR